MLSIVAPSKFLNDPAALRDIEPLAQKRERKRLVLGATPHALAAHEAVDVGHVRLLALGVDLLDAHGAGLVAGAAFGAGDAVLLDAEWLDRVGQAHEVAERTERAEEALDMLAEIITKMDFEDHKHLETLIGELKAEKKSKEK